MQWNRWRPTLTPCRHRRPNTWTRRAGHVRRDAPIWREWCACRGRRILEIRQEPFGRLKVVANPGWPPMARLWWAGRKARRQWSRSFSGHNEWLAGWRALGIGSNPRRNCWGWCLGWRHSSEIPGRAIRKELRGIIHYKKKKKISTPVLRHLFSVVITANNFVSISTPLHSTRSISYIHLPLHCSHQLMSSPQCQQID